MPVPTSYLSCCSSLHFAYITIVKITRRDITSEIHALTDENTASLPLFRDRSTIRVVESAPLFLYLRSTRCPRAPRRARESHIFGLRLLTSLDHLRTTRIDIDAASHHAANYLPPGGTVLFYFRAHFAYDFATHTIYQITFA